MFVYMPYSESNSPRMGIGFHLIAIRYPIPQLFKKICIMQRQTRYDHIRQCYSIYNASQFRLTKTTLDEEWRQVRI